MGVSTRLILVKHAMPEVCPDVPGREWVLSEAGRQSCRPLAERLRQFAPEAVVASPEPKASETGRLVAEQLGLPFESRQDLHENDRTGYPFVGVDRLHADIARFFASENELVMGRETARAAYDRFSAAVDGVVADNPGRKVVVVAHGTVISLLAWKRAGVDPFPFWTSLGLPSFVVFTVPGWEITDLVRSV